MLSINPVEWRATRLRLWPGLVAVLLAIVWLQPHHVPPWPGFHEDAGVALWFAACALVLTLLSLRVWNWTWPPICFAALSLVVAGQALTGQINSSGQALLFLGHLWACAVCWALAESWSQQDPYLPLDIFFLAVGITCVGNVAVALYQWLQIMPTDILSTAGVWLMDVGATSRAVGNVAQPNELAMMIAWAILGGVWGMHRGWLRWQGFVPYAFFLALGLALTQSRAGMLHLLLLSLGLALFRKPMGGWRPALWVALTSLVQLLIFLSLPWLLDLIGLSYDVRLIGEAVSKDVARINIYTMAVDAIRQSPWLGYGAQHFAQAQWAVVESQTWLHAFYMQAHNWGLDLLLWFGIPLGLSLMVLVLYWFYRVIQHIKQPKDVIALLAVLCFMLYASVELPHWTTNLLLPAVALAGCLSAGLTRRIVWRSGLVFNTLILSVLSSLLVFTIMDYVRLERNFIQLRAEQLRLRTDISEVPQPWVLSHLAESFRMSRTSATPQMSEEDLRWYAQTIRATPVNQTMYQYILALGLNNQHAEARLWMRRLSAVSPESYQGTYIRVWARHQALHPKQLAGLAWETGK